MEYMGGLFSKWLGHVSLESTQIYTRIAIGKLKDVHTLTHSGAKNERSEKDLE